MRVRGKKLHKLLLNLVPLQVFSFALPAATPAPVDRLRRSAMRSKVTYLCKGDRHTDIFESAELQSSKLCLKLERAD